MVKLVFVHGVNVRKPADSLFPVSAGDLTYDQAEKSRNDYFQKSTFPGLAFEAFSPYWGQFGCAPEGRFACIPGFTPPPAHGAFLAASAPNPLFTPPVNPLLNEAANNQNFRGVVQTLSVQSTLSQPDPATSEVQRDFWRKAASYALDNASPAWLTDGSVTTDTQFLQKLKTEVEGHPTPDAANANFAALLPGFDPLGWLGSLGTAAATKVIDAASVPLATFARRELSPHIGIFEGDIFRYLRSAEPRNQMRGIVQNQLVAAANAAQASHESLVVVTHSMGGPILYDMLTDSQELAAIEALVPGFKIDLWISVGSQVGIFEEAKSYISDTRAPPTYPLTRPACITTWWNYFNKVDVLSFLAEPIWTHQVEDITIDTAAGIIEAHGAYFTGTIFYEDLRRRASLIGII